MGRPKLGSELHKWNQKLAAEGLFDEPKEYDRRTIGFENRDPIRDFFLRLDHLMTHYPEMPKFERKVMELYSQGIEVIDIIKRVRASRATVFMCIKRYKNLVIAIQRSEGAPILFPDSLRPKSNEDSKDLSEPSSIHNQAA